MSRRSKVQIFLPLPMGYEARIDARNDYIAEVIAEHGGSSENSDEEIEQYIEDGMFDAAVIRRYKALEADGKTMELMSS